MNSSTNSKTSRYSKQGLWKLFLVCACPIHIWALLAAFGDISWVSARTNMWDAIGVFSYGMVFAFIESVVIFIVVALLGFMISTKWNENHRIALLSILMLIAALWAMDGQAFFIWGNHLPGKLQSFVAGMKHPYRFLYGTQLGLVFTSIIIPAGLVLKSSRFLRMVENLLERITLLSVFYLLFDLAGLIIVIIRNI